MKAYIVLLIWNYLPKFAVKPIILAMKLKSTLVLAAMAAWMPAAMSQTVEQITIKDKTYDARLLLKREIGPGTTYLRYRMPEFPLNFNMMIVDLNNEYNTVENMQSYEQL